MILDPTISWGNILQTVAFLGTCLLFLVRQSNGITSTIALVKRDITEIKTDIVEVKQEFTKLNGLMTTTAVNDRRLLNMEDDIRNLQHGKGFVRESLDKEWGGKN